MRNCLRKAISGFVVADVDILKMPGKTLETYFDFSHVQNIFGLLVSSTHFVLTERIEKPVALTVKIFGIT